MRQTPAITQLTLVGPDGRERLRISNLKQDVTNSLADLSADLAFLEAAARKVYRGKVEFRQQSVPYITIARSGAQKSAGVVIADVNLRFMWDVVLGIKVGETGRTIVVDQTRTPDRRPRYQHGVAQHRLEHAEPHRGCKGDVGPRWSSAFLSRQQT